MFGPHVTLLTSLLVVCKGVFIEERLYDGNHYVVSNLSLPYDQALSHCNSVSYKLVEIHTKETQEQINELLSQVTNNRRVSHNDFMWTGLKLKKLLDKGRWNGRTYFIRTSYSNWAPNQPSKGAGICVTLVNNGDTTGSWFNNDCQSSFQFICQGKSGPAQVSVLSPHPTVIPSSTATSITTTTTVITAPQQPLQVVERLQRLSAMSGGKPMRRDEIENLSATIDGVLKHKIQATAGSSETSDFIRIVEDISRRLTLNEDSISCDFSNLFVGMKKLTSNVSTVGEDIKIRSIKTEGSAAVKPTQVSISKSLVEEIVEKADNNSALQLNMVVYKNQSSLFIKAQNQTLVLGTDRQVRYPSLLLSDVISVSIPGLDTSNLTHPFTYFVPTTVHDDDHPPSLCDVEPRLYADLPHAVKLQSGNYYNRSSGMRYRVAKRCAYLDTTVLRWLTGGCRTQLDEKNETICVCYHMTHFSVIFEITEMYAPEYLSYITLFGCTLSVICLALTILITLSFRQIRTKILHQIILHISIALLLLNVSFVVGIDQTSRPLICLGSTLTIHYAVLLSWSWMLVEGLFLFKSIVWSRMRAMSNLATRGAISTITIAYTVPAAVVTASYYLMDEYQSERFCWLKYEPLMYTVIIPVGFILSINLFVLIHVMYFITCKSRIFTKRSDFNSLSLATRRAFCMLFALGIPWILGYFMLIAPDQNTKHYLSVAFSVINSLQGLAIFFFYCYRQDNIRKLCDERLIAMQAAFAIQPTRTRQPATSQPKKKLSGDQETP